MLFATDKLKMISKFYFVCELLPFVKDSSFSDENTIVIARTIAFQLLLFVPKVFRMNKFGVM